MASENAVRVGTRGSRLALWQADHVVARLVSLHPGLHAERKEIRTTGDRVLDTALSKIGDKGLFTKELEDALRGGEIDLAVHSLKDLPTEDAPGLRIGAVLAREDPRDAFVSFQHESLASLPAGARVGTSSLRRRAQLLALRPDLRVEDLRGNVPTRVERVRRGDYAAAVLAYAGLTRLGLEDAVRDRLSPEDMLSAVGQGAIAIQTRAADTRIASLVAPLDHAPTRLAVAAERALLRRLEGGCQVPVGALATLASDELELRGLVAAPDGGRVVRGSARGPVAKEEDAAAIGTRLAEGLLRDGADAILRAVRAGQVS